MKPEAVIFDIGNVLITWAPERLFDTLLPLQEREAIFARVGLHAMNDEIDRGAPWRETIEATARRWPEYHDLIMLWHERWLDMASPTIPHSWQLLRALRAKRIPVFALSNFGRESFAFASGHYPELAEFDRRYISGHLGTIKPEARIYEIVEQDCGLPPEALLFTDDRAENIAAAAGRGWQTHLFTGAEGLAERLVAAGLLSSQEAKFRP
jgi:2-haloacid dehalogenase